MYFPTTYSTFEQQEPVDSTYLTVLEQTRFLWVKADHIGWQIVDRGEAAKGIVEETVRDSKSDKPQVKKRRSHDDKLG